MSKSMAGQVANDLVAAWSRQASREIMAELHRNNPGTDRADELEILAQDVFGWLY